MKTKVFLLGFVILVASSAFAGPVPKAIKARYSSLEKVMKKLDFKAFSAYFADEFTTIDPKGKSTTRDQFLTDVKPMFENAKKATVHVKLISATKHDGMVDVKFDFKMSLTGKSGTTTMHEVGTDTWKMVGTQWLFVKTVDTKMDMMMPKPEKID